MRASGEKPRISDEAERVYSVSCPHITVVAKLRLASRMRLFEPLHATRSAFRKLYICFHFLFLLQRVEIL